MQRPIHRIIIIVACFLCSIMMAQADKTTTTTTSTVQRLDIGFGTPECNAQGTGCTVTVVTTVETSSVITTSGSGFILQVGNTDMYGAVIRGGTTTYLPLINRAITFPPTTTVTIDDSPAYPFLNGRIINISGISTNINGGYTVSFLP